MKHLFHMSVWTDSTPNMAQKGQSRGPIQYNRFPVMNHTSHELCHAEITRIHYETLRNEQQVCCRASNAEESRVTIQGGCDGASQLPVGTIAHTQAVAPAWLFLEEPPQHAQCVSAQHTAITTRVKSFPKVKGQVIAITCNGH